MKAYPILLILVLALAGCNHAPHAKRYVVDIEMSEIAFDGIEEEKLGHDQQISIGGRIRLVEVVDDRAVVEFLQNGFKSEAKVGGRFPYKNGNLSALRLLEADPKNQSIRFSYPFGGTETRMRVVYNDGTHKDIQK
jgi:starvation-inducible outer membrane lipoprotein